MNKESLKEYLSSRYQGWSSFLNNVIFPIFGEDDFEDGFETELLESQPERRQLAEATGIRSIKQVGMMYVGVEPLQIFDVTVSDRVMMEQPCEHPAAHPCCHGSILLCLHAVPLRG